MCFAPKIKMPQVNPERVPEPAPLTQEVTGVEYGGTTPADSAEDELSGRKQLKVERKDSEATGSRMKTSIRKALRAGGK